MTQPQKERTAKPPLQPGERRRLTSALLVLMAGLLVFLAAVGMAMLRGPLPEQEAGVQNGQHDEGANGESEPQHVGLAMPILGGLAGLLLVTMLIVGYALFRLTRALALPESAPKRPDPTAHDDVWTKHRLPEDVGPDASGQAEADDE